MCCPSLSNSVIGPAGTAGKWRRKLYWIAVGEVVDCVLKATIFGILQEVFNLANVWIDYLSYATMHLCQALTLSFSAIFDIVLIAINYNLVPHHTFICISYSRINQSSITWMGARHVGQLLCVSIHCKAHSLWNRWLAQPAVVSWCSSIGYLKISHWWGCWTNNDTGAATYTANIGATANTRAIMDGFYNAVTGESCAARNPAFFWANSALRFIVCIACWYGKFIRLAKIVTVLACETRSASSRFSLLCTSSVWM